MTNVLAKGTASIMLPFFFRILRFFSDIYTLGHDNAETTANKLKVVIDVQYKYNLEQMRTYF